MRDGSYVTYTDSACLVRPLLTVSYEAVPAEPPEYPEVTRTTPLTCSKTACTPQKHPPATTIVSVAEAVASGASTAGSGTSDFAAVPLRANVVSSAYVTPMATSDRRTTRKREYVGRAEA